MSKLKLAASKQIHDKIEARLARKVPKDAGGGTFTFGRSTKESPTQIRYVVLTGIKAFDDRVGGMPVGKAIELVGLPQSGKTTMAIRTAGRMQQGHLYELIHNADGTKTYKKLKPGTFQVTVAYYDQEGSMSDPDKRIVDGQPLDAEILQCDTIELLFETMDSVLEVLKEVQEETGVLQFLAVIVDTVGSLSTKAEMLQAWGKTDFPRVPRQLKDGIKYFIGRMQRENVLLMGLNHVSKRMDMIGRPSFKVWQYKAPGGEVFAYYSYHRVFFEMVQTRYSLSGKGRQDGYLIYFQTLKNRIVKPLIESRMALIFTVRDRTSGELVEVGGFKEGLSLLEAIIYGKAATVSKQTGAIAFQFTKFGIQCKTFEAPQAESLEEQEEGEAVIQRRSPPKIPNRAAWEAFYAAHKDDLDALYEAVTTRDLARSDTQGPLTDDGEASEDEDE